MKNNAKLKQRRSAVRKTILDGAREAVAENGYQSFSMRKLAESIGYSPGALYLYFETREDLLNCLVEEAFAKLLEILNEVHDRDDPVRSLENKMRAYVDFGLLFPDHYQFAFLIRPNVEKTPTTYRPHAAYDVMRHAVRRCLEEGRLPWPDIETSSQILWVTLHGITSLLIVRPNFPWVDRENLIDNVIGTAIHGLGRRATQSGGER
jgi:AcrR family transcriptional regulator